MSEFGAGVRGQPRTPGSSGSSEEFRTASELESDRAVACFFKRHRSRPFQSHSRQSAAEARDCCGPPTSTAASRPRLCGMCVE